MPARQTVIPEVAGSATTSAATDPGWAWASYEPDAARPWNLVRAGHLLRRAGFGGSLADLQQALADGPGRTVDRLLQPAADLATFYHDADKEEESAVVANSVDMLRAWWLRRMILSPHPLLEKLTLFWHGYFAAANRWVGHAGLMSRHVRMLRMHALGRFDVLLREVLQDPAVLLSLDARANRKSRPSLFHARAVLEYFTVGPGQFHEDDVRALARSTTGWFVMMNRLRYFPREHDESVKRLLGQEGKFSTAEAADLLAHHPATSQHVVRRLYDWLISEEEPPSGDLIAPLAQSFARDLDLARLAGTMLRSNLFFSATAYRQRVKCPVEFAVGIVKGLEGMVGTTKLGQFLASLGQDLYNPPTVRGWAGGRQWISRVTLLGRNNLAAALLAGEADFGEHLDPTALLERYGAAEPAAIGDLLADIFCQGDLPQAVRNTLLQAARQLSAPNVRPAHWIRQFAHLVVTLPEFQLA